MLAKCKEKIYQIPGFSMGTTKMTVYIYMCVCMRGRQLVSFEAGRTNRARDIAFKQDRIQI